MQRSLQRQLTTIASTTALLTTHFGPVCLQARALGLSTLLTGSLGLAGFYALKEAGFFSTDRAELPSAKEAAALVRDPRVRTAQAAHWPCDSLRLHVVACLPFASSRHRRVRFVAVVVSMPMCVL